MANPVTNFIDKLIANRVEEALKVKDELSKKASSDIVFSGLSRGVGYNPDTPLEKPYAKGVSFSVLRSLANFYPIARACINYRKGQMSQLDWDISLVSDDQEGEEGVKISEEDRAKIKEIKSFFKYPTGDRSITFRHFMSQLLEDVLVIDALALYKRKTRVDGIYGYLPVDGATIKLKIEKDGTTPIPPETAYVQEINGKKITELTSEEMIYKILNPRTITPYGQSPLETLIVTVSTALKLQSYNLGYLTEGNVPEGFVELPKEIVSSPDQLTKWQRTWDSIMSGDPRAMSRLRFLPEGMKYTPTKKPEDMSYERFERWLLQNTCAVFDVPPQNIGFTYDTNRATGETQWQVGKEKGLFPLALFMKELFDRIIQEDFGYENFEFVWTNLNPTNAKEEADVFNTLVGTGAMSVDEWRIGEGLDPIGLGHYIKTGGGVVLVKKFLEDGGDTSQAGAANEIPLDQLDQVDPKKVPKEVKAGESNATEGKPNKEVDNKAKKILGEFKSNSTTALGVEDLRKWKKAATHDLERGRAQRDFQTELVDSRVKSLLKDGLKKVTNPQEINELFEPFLSPESRIVSSVLDLYDELGQILNS